jgi:hypothetical protein
MAGIVAEARPFHLVGGPVRLGGMAPFMRQR